MNRDVGVWIDHKKAVIVSIAAGEVTTRTLTSDVGAHPHYSGSKVSSESIVAVESTDKLTDPQIVAKVNEHYGAAR